MSLNTTRDSIMPKIIGSEEEEQLKAIIDKTLSKHTRGLPHQKLTANPYQIFYEITQTISNSFQQWPSLQGEENRSSSSFSKTFMEGGEQKGVQKTNYSFSNNSPMVPHQKPNNEAEEGSFIEKTEKQIEALKPLIERRKGEMTAEKVQFYEDAPKEKNEGFRLHSRNFSSPAFRESMRQQSEERGNQTKANRTEDIEQRTRLYHQKSSAIQLAREINERYKTYQQKKHETDTKK